MNPKQIVIQKQIIDLEINKLENTNAFFVEWREVFNNKILPAIEKIINPFIPGKELLVIDKLEISIVYSTEGEIQQVLFKAINEQLETQFSAILEKKETANFVSPKKQQQQILRTYFTTGLLPKWYIPKKEKDIAEIVQIWKKKHPKKWDNLVKEWSYLPDAKNRISYFLSNSNSGQINKNRRLTETETELIAHLNKKTHSNYFKRQLWETYVENLTSSKNRKRLHDFFSTANTYQLFSESQLQKIWDQLKAPERKQLKFYLKDLMILNKSDAFIAPHDLRKTFLTAAIKYKLKSKNKGFDPRILLSFLMQEIAFLKKEKTVEIWRKIHLLFKNNKNISTFESPLPDLINQYFSEVFQKNNEPKQPEIEHNETDVKRKKHPLLIHYLYYGTLPKQTNQSFDIATELEEFLATAPQELKKYLPIIFQRTATLNRLLHHVPIKQIDQLLILLFEQNKATLLRLITDTGRLFKDNVFPEQHLLTYQKEVRRQLVTVMNDLPENYPKSLGSLWKKLCSYYDIDFQDALQKIDKTKHHQRVVSSIELLQKERTTKEIEQFLSKISQLQKQQIGEKNEIRIEQDVTSPQVELSSLEIQFFELQFYFEKGYLRPDFIISQPKEIEKLILLLIREKPKLSSVFFRNGLWQKQWKVEVINQLPAKVLLNIAAILYTKSLRVWKLYWNDLKSLFPPKTTFYTLKERNVLLRQRLINYFIHQQDKRFHEAEFTLSTLEYFAEKYNLSKQEWIMELYVEAKSKADKFKTDILDTVFVALDQLTLKDKDKNIFQLEKLIAEMENGQDDLFINNAGIILLATWLPEYFRRLNLLNPQQQFKDSEAQQRAVHLLQYLVTKETQTPEYFMVFNKILCGIPIIAPIIEGIEINESEMEIAEQMLLAVIQNWKELGNTSPEGLSGNFLIRAGKLEELGTHWTLNVESKGYDVLLQFLPWSYSMVKLPWMEKRIQTNWQ